MTQAAEHLPAHATASVDTTGPSHNPHNGSSSGQALSSAPGAWTPDRIANLAVASPTAQPTAEQTQYATAELNHQTLGCTVAAGLASPGPLLDAPMLADRFTECSPQATSSSRGAAEDARRTAAADSNALHHVPCTPAAGPQKEAVATGESEVLVGMAHTLVSSWPSPVANTMHGSTHSASASDMSLAGWGSVKHLVVYGLGSLEDSSTSRYQVGGNHQCAAHTLPYTTCALT